MRGVVRTTIIAVSLVTGLAMPVATGALADDVAQCKQLGYQPGTALFLQCLSLYQQQRAQAHAEQAAAEARRAAECSAALTSSGGGLITAFYRHQLQAQCAGH